MENPVSCMFCFSLRYLCPVEAYNSKRAADEVRSKVKLGNSVHFLDF